MTSVTTPRRLCVAPMMERTDRHCRYLLRQLAPDAWLYTEMITAAALLRGDAERLLAFDVAEHPVALQLGGSEPDQLAAAAKLGADAGYDEININVGCPSPRVQCGAFGVALMREPQRVADCVRAMNEAVAVPVTVKTRIGVDKDDDYEFLQRFVDAVVAAGCRTLIVHARKAWLNGLSPKENRNVPPLDYPRVYQLKRDYPGLEIIINGGLVDVDTTLAQLAHVDGVMLGRAAYHDPFVLAELNRRIFGEHRAATREDALHAFIRYAQRELARGTPLKAMSRHLMGLYANRPGARQWRRTISELAEGSAGLGTLCELSRSSRSGRYNEAAHRSAIVQSTVS
jgi:tRNA-dihydrouridine synthase A